MEGKYSINVICTNCDYSGSISLPRGTSLDGFMGYNCCPHCGCNTLRKDNGTKVHWNYNHPLAMDIIKKDSP